MGSLNSSLSYLITALNRDVWIHHRHTYQEANGYLLINHSYYSIYFVSIPISGDESKRTIKKTLLPHLMDPGYVGCLFYVKVFVCVIPQENYFNCGVLY